MSDTLESLRRKLDGAKELQSVARTMKTLAAVSIGQYQTAVSSLTEYYRTVELGLTAYLRQSGTHPVIEEKTAPGEGTFGAIVFGSDQGLVGQFNETLAKHVSLALNAIPGRTIIWAVGERMQSQLADANLAAETTFAVPNSVNSITPLIGQILVEMERHQTNGKLTQVHLFHNRPNSVTVYESATQRLLPLDTKWRDDLRERRWPTANLPEIIDPGESTWLALIREYLFVSIFRACAQSLASENASRLMAMQRAEKNIGELLENMGHTFHRLRQSSIDEELFDLIAGFEALSHDREESEAQF